MHSDRFLAWWHGRPRSTHVSASGRTGLGASLAGFLCGLLALLAGGCGGPASLLEVPIQRLSESRDLIAAARRGPGASPQGKGLLKRQYEHLVARVEVAANSAVLLDGRLVRTELSDPREIGPVEFTVELDGRAIFARELTSSQRRESFTETVSLSPWEGQTVELDMRIENRDLEHSKASWRRIQLQVLEPLPRRPASAGPNLLLVVVDTLRADHCSLYGYQRDTTPFLERLGEESLVFEHAVSPASWTLPAMTSLFTGTYPPRHGAVQGGRSMKPSFETLAEVVQSAGLTTVGISANPLINFTHGFDQGFEEFRDVPWRRAAAVNRIFESWLEDKQDLQWFAYLHHIDPHDPYNAPTPEGARYVDPDYAGVFTDKTALNRLYFSQNYGLEPVVPFGPQDIRFLIDAYDGEIRYWDRQLQNLVEHLGERGLLERTIVIVLSDHGEEFVEHAKLKHGHHLYDESVRVPLLIRYPRLGKGRRQRPVETQRVFEAALRLLGLSSSALEPGDLLSADDREVAVFSHASYPLIPHQVTPREAMAAIRLSDWKLIRNLDHDRMELYHLGRDPREQTDLSAGHPEIAEPLSRSLQAWLAAQSSNAAEESSPIDPETIEKLRALGYLQ